MWERALDLARRALIRVLNGALALLSETNKRVDSATERPDLWNDDDKGEGRGSSR